ncbi:MAG TPA: hypothetical protein VMV20_01800, partial [Chitinophagaceae bacterium]|nr:hypothetical protein [Chitinophagaceae bacterium]
PDGNSPLFIWVKSLLHIPESRAYFGIYTLHIIHALIYLYLFIGEPDTGVYPDIGVLNSYNNHNPNI